MPSDRDSFRDRFYKKDFNFIIIGIHIIKQKKKKFVSKKYVVSKSMSWNLFSCITRLLDSNFLKTG